MDGHTPNPLSDDSNRAFETDIEMTSAQWIECHEHLATGKTHRVYLTNAQGTAFLFEASDDEIEDAFKAGFEAAHRLQKADYGVHIKYIHPLTVRKVSGIRYPMGHTQKFAFNMGLNA